MTSDRHVSHQDLRQSRSNDASVAIILRTKDRPILLPRALDSIIQQTHRNWRLYIVNDGGDRGLVHQAIENSGAADQITAVHNPITLGMEAASNIALANADATYLAIHDDDDSWHPNFLTSMLRVFDANDKSTIVGVFANCQVIRERICGSQIIEIERESWKATKTLSFDDLFVTNLYPPICLLAKTSAVRVCGAFDASMPVLGDWDFNIRLLKVGEICCIEDVLAYYHLREEECLDESYGNTVTQKRALHEEVANRLRNGRVRSFLNESSAADGLLHLILPRLARIEDALALQRREILPDYIIRKIATEVWFEKQRWSSVHKLLMGIRTLLNRGQHG